MSTDIPNQGKKAGIWKRFWRDMRENPLMAVTLLLTIIVTGFFLALSLMLQQTLPTRGLGGAFLLAILSLIVGLASGTVAGFVDRVTNHRTFRSIIIDSVRGGIEHVSCDDDEEINVDIKKLAETAREHLFILRPIIFEAVTTLPITKLHDVITRGAKLQIVLPVRENEFVIDRLARLRGTTKSEAKDRHADAMDDYQKTLLTLVERCKENNAAGKLEVKEYDGQFPLNILGNERKIIFGIPWAHEYAVKGPQIHVTENGPLGRYAYSHFNKIWNSPDSKLKPEFCWRTS